MDSAEQPSYGWLVGRVHGIPVYLGRSWPIVAVAMVLAFGPTVGVTSSRWGGYALALGYVILLLLSTLAHEGSHALVARLLGARVDRVVADLWGGHTVYAAESLRPGQTGIVAVAGPAANLLLAALAWAANPNVTGSVGSVLLWMFFVLNLLVGLFNLLPGLPLDGGFILDAVIWRLTGRRSAGLIAAGWAGRLVAVGSVVLLLGLPLLRGDDPQVWSFVVVPLLGAFVWSGASRAVHAGAARAALERIRVGQLMRPVVVVPAHASGARIADALVGTPTAEYAVLADPRGTPVGFIDTVALAGVPEGRLATVPASSFLLAPTRGWVVQADPGDDAVAVVSALAGQHVGEQVKSAVLVQDRFGRLVGTVSMSDLDAVLSSSTRA
jgi:Zn-dependent protease